MIIECPKCRARFRLDESKIRGKGARVKCRRCGDPIVVLRNEGTGTVSQGPGGEGSFDLGSVLRESPAEGPARSQSSLPRNNLIPFPGAARVPEPAPPQEKDEVDAAFDQLLAETASTPEPGAPATVPKPDFETAPGETANGASGEFLSATEAPPPAAEAAHSAADEAPGTDGRLAVPEFAPEERLDLAPLLPEAAGAQEAPAPVETERRFLASDSETFDFLSAGSKVPDEARDADISEAIASVPFELDAPPSLELEATALPSAADFVPPREDLPVEGNVTPQPAPEEPVPPGPPHLPPAPARAASGPYPEPPAAGLGVPRPASSGLWAAVVVLLAVVLAVAGYFGFTASGQKSVEDLVPRIASLVGLGGSSGAGPGYEVKNVIGYYESGNAGPRILVIKGQVTNRSKVGKSGIRVRATLLDGNEQPLGDQTVYAGNLLPAAKVKTGDRGALEKALANPLGERLSNVDVQPGKTVPFMVLFFDAPESIDSYRLEAMDNQ